jgi:hypothetical protein
MAKRDRIPPRFATLPNRHRPSRYNSYALR